MATSPSELKPKTFSDWINTGIYGLIAFLMVFGFNRMDETMSKVNDINSELRILRYRLDLNESQILEINSDLKDIEERIDNLH